MTKTRNLADLGGGFIQAGMRWLLGPSVTPGSSGELMIEATNDTTLTFKYKGSDDVVRSGTITLS